MPLERLPAHHSYVEVLERVLDKGIVIDVSLRISVIGIEVLAVDADVVVVSIETYLHHADLVRYIGGSGEVTEEDGASRH
ncbi:MAG: gas vesicle protein GvpJ [Longimicrobiales bacterium]